MWQASHRMLTRDAAIKLVLAAVSGMAAGALSLNVLPQHVARGPMQVTATWMLLPLAAGGVVVLLDLAFGGPLRSKLQGVLTGVVFGLAYLAIRGVIPGAGG